MNKQDNREPANQSSTVEDLTVVEDRQTDIKGGATGHASISPAFGDGSVRTVKDSISGDVWR